MSAAIGFTLVPGVEPAENPINFPLGWVEAKASPMTERAELWVHKKRMLYGFICKLLSYLLF